MKPPEVIVIGAGVVGVTCALALQANGLQVTILDRAGVAAEASSQNAGALAFSEIEPLAAPGIMRKAPKWLLDPTGPLSVPPTYGLKIAPWMFRFWRASRPTRFAAGLKAQTALMTLSRTAFLELAATAGAEDHLRHEGQLQLYEGVKEYHASLPAWKRRNDHGIKIELLEGPDQIANVQPGLSPSFTHAGFTPNWINLNDPKKWVELLADRFRAKGGQIELADVTDIAETADGMAITAGQQYKAKRVVLCAGAWSHRIARRLGDRIPLETERGYNTTLPGTGVKLRTHITFPNHGFVMSKIGDGLRIGGAVELGGLNRPPDYRRARAMLQKAGTFFPSLNTDGGTAWMGFRPSMPDSLPVIGPAPATSRVIYAFGHGHLGLTQSAGTARLVSEIISGQEPSIDLNPYRAQRFGGRP